MSAEPLSIPPRRKHPTPLRLRPEHRERLTQGKIDFAYALRVELDENDLLALFFEEEFAAWLEKRLASKSEASKE